MVLNAGLCATVVTLSVRLLNTTSFISLVVSGHTLHRTGRRRAIYVPLYTAFSEALHA